MASIKTKIAKYGNSDTGVVSTQRHPFISKVKVVCHSDGLSFSYINHTTVTFT